MKIRVLALGALAFALAAGLGASTGALADDQVVQLRLSHWVPPSHPLQPGLEAWAASIKEESKGSINITIFPSEQLGKAFDHYDMARDDIADITHVSPGYQPGRFAIIGGASLPFVFSNAKGGSAALDDWYRPYAATEMKDVHFCLAHLHDPGTFHSTKKIVVPADVKGLKVRPATGTIGSFVTSLGGTNVQASAPESRDILARGVADAITFPWGSIILFGIDKVVKYHIDAPLYVTPFVLVMNQGKYDAMSPAQKKVIDDHCTSEWAQKLASPWVDFESAGRDKIKAMPGHEIVELTPEQAKLWHEAAEPLKKQWADQVRKTGQDPDKVWANLEASLKKYNAAY